MKITFKRLTAVFISLIYLASLLPVISFAEDGFILNYDFEQEQSADSWLGAERDATGFESDWSMWVSNPYGDSENDIFAHFLEYSEYIHLEEGKFYTFSAYVLNPLADEESTPVSSAYIGRSGSSLFIDISSVGSEWSLVTASFMATEDTDSNLIITLEGSDAEAGFFIDNISILPETRVPKYTVLDGPDSVLIPQKGFNDYRYSIVTYDSDNLPINILINELDISADSLPEGVEFDPSTGYLRVHSYAESNSVFTLTCSPSYPIELMDSEKTITTTKNLFSDPLFEDGEMWTSEDDLSYSDGVMHLYASEQGDYGKYASISYTEQLLLYEGQMYVFRADVKSDEEFSSSSVYISNLSFASSGYAEINITGIGGDWTNVTSAFLIEDTGIYDLTINLYAPTERPIYITNVYLGVEDEAPTSLSIHAPGNIRIPSSALVLPCYSRVLNQLGLVMEGLNPTLTISPEKHGVYLSDGEIIVESSAHTGDYEIRSVYEGLESTLTITVSDNAIGDGGFEEKQANEWWTASDGSIFSIIDYDGDKSGHVYSPDSSCIIINNSYMELLKNEYYVYSASKGFGNGVVTAFIADAYSGEYIPFAQYDPEEETIVPFSLDQTVIGRLLLYVESDSSIGMIFDDISIVPAELSVSEINISGGEYGDYLHGSYTYINNMTTSPDADVSATRWYISPSYDGHYEPIGVPNQNYLEFTEDMVGQFIIFEVTPICAETGLVTDPIRSLPLQIAAEEAAENPERPLSVLAPIELDDADTHPFIDITSHWSEEMVSSLASAGIVSGRTQSAFYPDYHITRAEFTAMVARAFSLVAIPYSGSFDDVNESDWYSGWIEAAARRGIIKGVDETHFAPNERITREQMAVIIYRAYLIAQGPLPYDLPLRYYDNFMISPWAEDSVKNCTNLNLFTGDEVNLFKPQQHATRAEAAAVLYRTLKCF